MHLLIEAKALDKRRHNMIDLSNEKRKFETQIISYE